MEKGKILSIVVTAIFVAVISIFSFTFIHSNQSEVAPGTVVANENTKEENRKSEKGESDVTNQVENNVNGDEAEVTNSINNNLKNSDNNTIDNNITNNIDVNVDVNVTNNVGNHVEGPESNSDRNNDDEEQSNQDGNTKNKQEGNVDGNKKNASNDDEIVWGIDSASLTTEEMISCVRENFGLPKIWGRYLGEKEGVSSGLTSDEVELLHSKEINILVIWNHFTDATGYENGKKEAQQAINKANELGIPDGVAIFADIEPSYPVDAEFIKGWSEVIAGSNYSSGIYGIFDAERDLYKAFEKAASEDKEILENTYIWTASPNVGVTSEANAPEFKPEAPKNSLVSGWQYGIDAKSCNIDTNLFKGNITDVLWEKAG